MDYQLAGAIDATIDSGVEHGQVLVHFAAAVVGDNRAELDAARVALIDALGPGAVVTASLTAGNFSMLDRAANAIGINVDDMIVAPSADFREALGINAFPSAANTPGR